MAVTIDYTTGPVNFRDVGAFVNLSMGSKIMREGQLYRGGKTDYCKDAAEIGNPRTIINLRQGKDKKDFGANMLHFPIYNDYEKYNTTVPEVRQWLNEIFRIFENKDLTLPLFIHCLSGKDRTGIVVGTLLMLLEIPVETIVEEYLLSLGDVRKELFISALKGIGDPGDYFRRLDLPRVTGNLSGWFLKTVPCTLSCRL